MVGIAQHPWKVSIEEASALQRQLCELVVESEPLGEICSVAGLDISGLRTEGKVKAAAVLLSFPALTRIEECTVQGAPEFPYVPGYLSFRETPLMLEALRGLSRRPDLVLVDGHGRAHPRRLGIASHLGLVVDLPTIGCAKSRLVGDHAMPADVVGATTELVHRGDVIGMVLRSKAGAKPVFISVGHRMSLAAAVDLAIRCTLPGERIPEPTRLAHIAAGR